MKPIVRYRLLLVLIIGMLLYSCQQDDEFLESQQNIKPEIDYSNTNDIVLGEKLENPYAVATMKKALSNLNVTLKKAATAQASAAKTADVINTITVKPTHLYIKFLPKSEEELSILQSDSTLILYSYPLDYEIVAGSGYYRDPEVPAGQPTYQYCAVTIDKQLPSEIEHEILEELYIPDEDKIEESSNSAKAVRSAGYDTAINELVDEALRITNNLEKTTTEEQVSESGAIEITPKKLFRRRPKWRPAGTIKVWDDNIGQTTTTKRVFSHWQYYDCGGGGIGGPFLEERRVPDESCRRAVYRYQTVTTTGSYVPVEGVKVRARRWFTTHEGITNAQGRYSCNGRFRRDANYFIKWKRHQFSIWWSTWSAAKYRGPKKTGDWNLNIRGGTQEYYATIFRAAHLYWYGNIYGLHRPPERTFFGGRVEINAKLKNDRSSYAHARGIVFGSDIHLKEYGSRTSQVFGVTIHELAHAAHRRMDRAAYGDLVWKGYIVPWNSSSETVNNPGPRASNAQRAMETWATTVEHYLTTRYYREALGATDFIYENDFQWQTLSKNIYTSCGIDLMDDVDQRSDPEFGNGNVSYPIDRVKSYSILQLQEALRDVRTWKEWQNNIINNYENDTSKHVEELFDNWTR